MRHKRAQTSTIELTVPPPTWSEVVDDGMVVCRGVGVGRAETAVVNVIAAAVVVAGSAVSVGV